MSKYMRQDHTHNRVEVVNYALHAWERLHCEEGRAWTAGLMVSMP